MQEFPVSLSQFEDWFSSEEACIRHLTGIRWPRGFRCPHCGSAEAWMTGRGLYRCRGCDVQTSVTAGTIFQGTRKGVRPWLRAMWRLAEEPGGASASQMQRLLGLPNYRTAWTWLHKLRCVMAGRSRDRLTGMVEVDEAFAAIGRPRRLRRGRYHGELLIVAVTDLGGRAGQVRLRRLADGAPQSILRAVREMVDPSAQVRADTWPAYQGLPLMGYRLQSTRPHPSIVGVRPLPLVAGVVDELNTWLLGNLRGAIRPSHLDYYLAEFAFRFNHRLIRTPGKLFGVLVRQALESAPVADQEVVGGSPAEA
jgi:hypothetical protein